MSLIEMAQAFPDMSVTVKLADLRAAALELARQVRRDVEEEHRRRDRQAGSPLVDIDQVLRDFKVSTTTLWRWKRQGYLTPVKIGGRVYYRQADIDAIIEAHTDKSNF